MQKVIADISISLDGFITGPNDGPEKGLGDNGEVLHYWVMGHPWHYDDKDRQFTPLEIDQKVLAQSASIGAGIIGRNMLDATNGWGGNPPGGKDANYFVLAHEIPEQWSAPDSPFKFVTDGIESALEQAKAAADNKDVGIGGGANVIQQYLAAGLIDELRLHIAPVLLCRGKCLFDHIGNHTIKLERISIVESPYATHITFAVRH
jgi:dihydrofolate reductase